MIPPPAPWGPPTSRDRYRHAIAVLAGLGLAAVVLLSFVGERFQPIPAAAALAALLVLAWARNWWRHRRSLLTIVVVDIALLYLYLWTLDESIHVVVRATPHGYVATIGGRSAPFPVPNAGGRIGLFSGRVADYRVSPLGDAPVPAESGPMAWIAETLRFAVPRPAWANVHLAIRDPVQGKFHPGRLATAGGGWSRNRRGELEGEPGSAALITTTPYVDYTLSADLMRPDGMQGLLVGVNRADVGYLLALRMDDAAGLWFRWRHGPVKVMAAAPFRVDIVPMIQRDLRFFLPSVIIALLATTLGVLIYRPLFTYIRVPLDTIDQGKHAHLIDLFALGGAIAGGLAAATIATNVFHRVPNVQDAVAYLFQAKTLALGRLWTPAPILPSFFRVEFLPIYHGHWFGKYPPGWPAILAIGVLLGQPWLVSPVLVAADLFLLYLIGRKVYGRHVALLACLLAASSPFLLVLGGTFTAHAATLFYLSSFAYLMVRWRVRQPECHAGAPGKCARDWYLLLPAGFLLAMGFLSRELDAVAFALPFAALLLRRPRAMAWLLLGATGPTAFLLLYNRVLTGSVLTSPYSLWWSFDRLGFGPGVGGPEPGRRGFTLAQGIWNMGSDLQMLQVHLFGWPCYFALAFAALPFVLGRVNRWDALFALSSVCVMLAYIFYFNPGLWYGPRYYYTAIPWLALLTARGFQELYRLPARLFPASAAALIYPALLGLLLESYNLAYYFPAQITTYQAWNATDAATSAAIQRAHIHRGLVFVRSGQTGWGEYPALFSRNSPLLDGDVVYARDEGRQNTKLICLYPNRSYYRLHGTDLEVYSGAQTHSTQSRRSANAASAFSCSGAPIAPGHTARSRAIASAALIPLRIR